MRLPGLSAFILILLAACSFDNAEEGLRVMSLNSWAHSEIGYMADIDVRYGLSDVVIDALENGVPLVFIMKLNVEEKGASWLQEERATEYVFRVRYRPLSTLYEVERFGQGEIERQQFVTQDALFAYLGELRELVITDTSSLESEKTYVIAANIKLDIASLPLPMRPRAYLTPAWNQDSGWSRWPLNN